MKITTFDTDSDSMTRQDRNNANFIMNLCYLYDVYGIEETENMLMALGTDVIISLGK